MRISVSVRRFMLRLGYRGFVMVVVGSLALPSFAATAPRPPCETDPVPAYPALGAAAAVDSWRADGLPVGWTLPDCLQWADRSFGVLVAVAGRFGGVAEGAELLMRIGAISHAAEADYWSVTRQTWRKLYSESYALRQPDAAARRPDFSAAELTAGQPLYFWQRENAPASGAIYELRILEASSDRLAFAVTNATAITLLGFRVLAAGDFAATIFLTHDRDEVWSFYQLLRFGDESANVTQEQISSLINRAVASFRHLAGIPTDREPPAAP